MRDMFDTTTLRGIPLRNRVFRSATWMAMAGEGGVVTDAIVDLYRTCAQGRVGGIITGFTSISPHDRELSGAMRLDNDAHIAGHQRLTTAVHEAGGRVFTQMAMLDTHGTCGTGCGMPKTVNELSSDDMRGIVALYRDAAVRAERAGYDGAQIHAAHFFALSKCISPLHNQRQDTFGGSTEGRARLLVDIHNAMRGAVGDGFALLVKINCSDFVTGGLDENGFLTTCTLLDRAGIDAIEVSGNFTSRPNVRPGVNEGYFRVAAQRLKKRVRAAVMLVGGLRCMKTLRSIIADDAIDYVALSRPLICEPDLVKRWQHGDTRPARCLSCNACYNTPSHQCVLRLRGAQE